MSTEPLERINNPPETRVDTGKPSFKEQRFSVLLAIVVLLFLIGTIGYEIYTAYK